MSPISFRASRQLAWLWVALGALLIAGCGGGSGGNSSSAPVPPTSGTPTNCNDPADCGTVLVSFTDEDGDFLSYTVDVTSLLLEKANGANVETLPNSTRIDFSEYVDLSELVSAATIPPGDYVKGIIRVDYSNAEIFVEVAGEAVPAEVVDADGQPLGEVELEIMFDDQDQVRITRARTALLTIDFDLSASHQVDISTDPAKVVAEPFIVAEMEPIDEKEIRVRGALVSVDLDASTYTVKLRPWHRRDGDHGQVVVNTTDETTYEIDGEEFKGQAGLEALANQAEGTPVVAQGTLNVAEREFTANTVVAGDSVAGNGIAAVYGHVVARDANNQLTVKGVTIVRDDSTTRFRGTVLVDVGIDTSVRKVGGSDVELDHNAISVGQRILAFGQLTEDQLSATDIPTLDATEGRVRLLVTRVTGRVVSTLPGELVMNARGFGRIGSGAFNFAGTGMMPSLDADPTEYQVATGNLSMTDVITDTAVRVFGFVTPFGMAPPDFQGRTLVDSRDIRARLGVGWGVAGTTGPFMRSDIDGIVINLDNLAIDQRHHIVLGDRVVDLFDLPGSPPIIEPEAGRTLYSIVERGHIELFRDFDRFVAALNDRLGGGQPARSMAAYGSYDSATNTVTAAKIAVHMIVQE